MPPPPPPPPPPVCFPFSSKKGRRLSWSNSEMSRASYAPEGAARQPSHWSGSSATSKAPSLAFTLDSEHYDNVPTVIPQVQKSPEGKPKLVRGNTMTGTKKSTASSKWGYGWGIGKKDKMKEMEMDREKSLPSQPESMTNLPLYQPPVRRDSKSSHASRSTTKTQDSQKTFRTDNTKVSHRSQQSQETYRSNSSRSTAPKIRPPLLPQDSSSTLVGSAFERKFNDVEPIYEKRDTSPLLEELRKLMTKENLDFYIVPSEDAHGSEYVALSDKRREFITGFTGTAGQAIITKTNAFLITDARYWTQAREQTDHNWEVVQAGARGQPRDWIEWLEDNVKGSRIGLDARMIAHEKASLLNSKINAHESKLVFPPQNLVDLVWKDKPHKSQEPVYLHTIQYTGRDATYKIAKIRDWIKQHPPAVSSFHKGPVKPTDMHVGTLITSLPCVAYVLNLRGSDVPYNPLFHAYLYVGLDITIVFVDSSKVTQDVPDYLGKMNIQRRDYTDLWTFLRRREWGEGRILISPQTSYAISLMLTHYRYTVATNYVEHMMSIKNETELDGMRRAYLRDGVSYVRWLAWLESKLSEGYDVTEYEAGWRLNEYRFKSKNFMGLAYEPTSASGPNAALPHYTPKKSTARMIDRDTPYVNDSGGQYYDGTCDTTRTVHFGRPTPEQCDAYTRVLQGHIAIDSAIFPEGTSGHQLDVLARKALWKDGMNYAHGTGHGFGSFLTVHEGPHGFSSNIPLAPGHVITNEPGFYIEGKWGMRIESALAVRRVKTRGEVGGDVWLGFERLTCVPIQTKMVKESMLTKEEKQWLKEHNQRCLEKLAPLIKDDKRAMKWLKREADRGIGIASGPGGMAIDWD